MRDGYAAAAVKGSLTTAPAVKIAIEAHSIDPNLHRVLAEQIPRSGHLAEVEAYSHEIHALVRAYLERHRKEMRKLDPALAAFMCVSTIEAIAHNTALNAAEMLSEKMVKVLVDETTRMVVGYLSWVGDKPGHLRSSSARCFLSFASGLMTIALPASKADRICATHSPPGRDRVSRPRDNSPR
ncbi:hypothetical protein I6F18_14705 [Bradyrhizobium sp. NBAIM32]|nr:hypothetical protein [Bradyrhizobium sp. NBAIM32]